MNRCYHNVCGVEMIVSLHTYRLTVVADNLAYLLTTMNLTAIRPNMFGKRQSNMVAATNDAEGTPVIEIGNESMGGERCLVVFCRIEGQVSD